MYSTAQNDKTKQIRLTGKAPDQGEFVRQSYNPKTQKQTGSNKYNQGQYLNINHNINAFDNDQKGFAMDTNQSISGDLMEQAPGSQKNATKQQKGGNRITAATRGIQSGTNARVNTFDNRAVNTSKSPNIGNNPKVYDVGDRKNSFGNIN